MIPMIFSFTFLVNKMSILPEGFGTKTYLEKRRVVTVRAVLSAPRFYARPEDLLLDF